MPTGYTAFIEDGRVKDAKTFLHLCLRNFGICMSMREDGLSIKDDYSEAIARSFDESIDYHLKALASAKKKLDEYVKKSDDEKRKEFEDYIREETERLQKEIQESKVQESKVKVIEAYDTILEDIRNWKCSKDFESVKKFAIDQLEQTLDRDHDHDHDHDNSYEIRRLEELKTMTFEEDKDSTMKSLTWDVDYHTDELAEAQKRKTESIDWYRRFREELNKI